MDVLALTLLKKGDLPAAEALAREVVELSKKALKRDHHPRVLSRTITVAEVVAERGRFREAYGIMQRVLAATALNDYKRPGRQKLADEFFSQIGKEDINKS
jgi:hypothetical protein